MQPNLVYDTIIKSWEAVGIGMELNLFSWEVHIPGKPRVKQTKA